MLTRIKVFLWCCKLESSQLKPFVSRESDIKLEDCVLLLPAYYEHHSPILNACMLLCITEFMIILSKM